MKLNISNLQAFSAPCTIVQASVKLKKFDDRVTICLFLGYKYSSGGYRVWHPERRVVVEARDVIFFEDSLLTSPLHMSTRDDDLIHPTIDRTPKQPCTQCYEPARQTSRGTHTTDNNTNDSAAHANIGTAKVPCNMTSWMIYELSKYPSPLEPQGK